MMRQSALPYNVSIEAVANIRKMLKDALSVDENYILKLFKNDYTPVDASTSASFTDADFTNYVVKTLTRANWSSAATVSGKAESSYGTTPQSWTCGATGNTVYGYWVEGATSGDVLWAERFGTARVLAQDDVLNITPKKFGPKMAKAA